MQNQLNPMFEVKPVFRPLQTLVISLISSIFITMFFGSFLIPILGIAIGALVLLTMPSFKDTIAAAAESEVELSQSDFQTFASIFTSLPLLIGLALYLVATLIVYKSIKRTKNRTVYSFYEDHMLYYESYRTKNKTTVKYSSITSLDYSCSPFQDRLGLGTISISMAGRSKTINISDIPNSDEIYQKIEELTGTKIA